MRKLLALFIALFGMNATADELRVVYTEDPLVETQAGFHAMFESKETMYDAGECVVVIYYPDGDPAETFSTEGHGPFGKIFEELPDGRGHWLTLDEVEKRARSLCNTFEEETAPNGAVTTILCYSCNNSVAYDE